MLHVLYGAILFIWLFRACQLVRFCKHRRSHGQIELCCLMQGSPAIQQSDLLRLHDNWKRSDALKTSHLTP